MTQSLSQHKRVIFVAECIFDENTVFKLGYVRKYCNSYHPVHKNCAKVVHLIAGISAENGLEGVLLFDKPTNSALFLQLLTQLNLYGNH